MQVQVPARAEEACQKYDPTTKLIILRRSPKTQIQKKTGTNIPDHISESLETIVWVKNPEYF
jgi:hypothetical protein